MQAFECWTIFPEELIGIQEYPEETRLRESYTDWFKTEGQWNSQEGRKMESEQEGFKYWLSRLRK